MVKAANEGRGLGECGEMSAERGEGCGETSVERETSLGSVEMESGDPGESGESGERVWGERVWDSGTLGSGDRSTQVTCHSVTSPRFPLQNAGEDGDGT